MHPYLMALLGGILIGLAATLLLAFNGRIAGISGIFNQIISSPFRNSLWCWCLLGGLLLGGVFLRRLSPELFINASGRSFFDLLIAGFLVGFGAVLANGCTSGHGVCGISRFSKRSIAATSLFIVSGVLTVITLRMLGWSL